MLLLDHAKIVVNYLYDAVDEIVAVLHFHDGLLLVCVAEATHLTQHHGHDGVAVQVNDFWFETRI